MATPPAGNGDNGARQGYYPDPSIPGYVRYWNGVSWVPGTSRPAPAGGEPLPLPPGVSEPAAVPGQATAPVEETGPVFFDEEEPQAVRGDGRDDRQGDVPDGVRDGVRDDGARPEPATAWQADTSHQGGFGGERDRRVAWGTSAAADPRLAHARAPEARGPEARGPQASVPDQPSRPLGQTPPTADGTMAIRLPETPAPAPAPAASSGPPAAARAAATGTPGQPNPTLVEGAAPADPASPASWPQQVQRLAQSPGGEGGPVPPWKPVTEDPFTAAARARAAARPARLGRRLAARLIDTLVLGAVTGVAAVPAATTAYDHVNAKIDEAKLSGETVTVWLIDGTTAACLGGVLAALLIFGVLYEALPTAKWGRTLGKKLCGLEVRDIEKHVAPSFGAALRRWLVYSVPGVLVVGVVGVAWCLFDRPWRQCWHDKAAHTFVAG
ncbi:RDD family protein [Streptomyces sp. O3]